MGIAKILDALEGLADQLGLDGGVNAWVQWAEKAGADR
jgi:hypothetical protein